MNNFLEARRQTAESADEAERERLQREAQFEAGKVLDAKQAESGVPLDTGPSTEHAEKTAEIIQFPKPEAGLREQKPGGELSDLTEKILKDLEGKTDKEKIEILLSGQYDPYATSEAMSEILGHQKVA